jgi:hypothetical protein
MSSQLTPAPEALPAPEVAAGRDLAPTDPIARTAQAVAELLAGDVAVLRDPTGSDLVFESELTLHELASQPPPNDVWAVDGGQALVADARCFQVGVTRAATVRWRHDACVVEDPGALRVHLLGTGDDRGLVASLGIPVAPGAPADLSLLRDAAEWQAVTAAVAEAEPGGLVLVDGDLAADWRISAAWLSEQVAAAARRGVLLAGITKHSSLAWGGAPLLGVLERRAEATFGPRRRWWSKVATSRPDPGPGLQVIVARLDPDARYAFRIDLPLDVDAASSAGAIAALANDAAFPGYPYPLSVADRLASCPRWLRDDLWDQLRAHLQRAGVPADVAERAFDDRHRMMERS